MKPSGPGLLFAGRFLITVSFSMLVMGLLNFLFLPGSVLESYTFLSICPFLPSWKDIIINPHSTYQATEAERV